MYYSDKTYNIYTVFVFVLSSYFVSVLPVLQICMTPFYKLHTVYNLKEQIC